MHGVEKNAFIVVVGKPEGEMFLWRLRHSELLILKWMLKKIG